MFIKLLILAEFFCLSLYPKWCQITAFTRRTSVLVSVYWMPTVFGGNHSRNGIWRFHEKTSFDMLPSSCITTSRDDCYLCAASQRTPCHHSREKLYIDSLHVFMRHHHIRRQVYSFMWEIQGMIWPDLSSTLLLCQKQRWRKNMLATLLPIISLLPTLLLAITTFH